MTGKKAKGKNTKGKSQKSKAKKPAAKRTVVKNAKPKIIKATVKKPVPVSNWALPTLISTMFATGRIPFAPGTWGSLWGVALFPTLAMLPQRLAGSPSAILPIAVAILVILYLVGIVAIRSYQAKTGNVEDSQEIVYDEFFGQILTYSLITAFFAGFALKSDLSVPHDIDYSHSMIRLFTPFLFFRLFDICKPWPIFIADRELKSARGVMIDDVLAAIYAAVCSVLVFFILDGYIL